MYLTAQRVRASDGREGVNVIGYSHRGATYADIDWRNPDVVHISEEQPGRLMFTVFALDTKGNSVRSFLDVAVSDEVPARTVAALLEAAALSWQAESSQSSAVWARGPMSLRLYVAPSLNTSSAAEFRALKDKLLLAVANVVTSDRKAPSFAVRPPHPVRLLRRRGAVSDRFLLDRASREALGRVLGAGVTIPASVNVTLENKAAFQQFVGSDLLTEIVLTFTHCTLEQLDALGGAIVADEATGEELWRSPGLR
ncbi:MAG: hypothetical protein ACYC8T_24955 [Myxococcaceae bacterium]